MIYFRVSRKHPLCLGAVPTTGHIPPPSLGKEEMIRMGTICEYGISQQVSGRRFSAHIFNYFNASLIKMHSYSAFLFADSCSLRYTEKQLISANFRTEIVMQISEKMLKASGEK